MWSCSFLSRKFQYVSFFLSGVVGLRLVASLLLGVVVSLSPVQGAGCVRESAYSVSGVGGQCKKYSFWFVFALDLAYRETSRLIPAPLEVPIGMEAFLAQNPHGLPASPRAEGRGRTSSRAATRTSPTAGHTTTTNRSAVGDGGIPRPDGRTVMNDGKRAARARRMPEDGGDRAFPLVEQVDT